MNEWPQDGPENFPCVFPVCYAIIKNKSKVGAVARKEVQTMNMSENSRLILGLRAKGWSDTEITDFILWIGTGERQYKPKSTVKHLKRKQALWLEQSNSGGETDLESANLSLLDRIKRNFNAAAAQTSETARLTHEIICESMGNF